MNSISGDSESSGDSNSSDQGGADKNIIDKILGEMKSQFNMTDRKQPFAPGDPDDEAVGPPEPPEVETEHGSGQAGVADSHADGEPSEPEASVEKTEERAESANVDAVAEGNPEAVRDGDVNGGAPGEGEKPRIVLLFKKPTAETPVVKEGAGGGRRSLRHKPSATDEKSEETTLKRSARRRSKDCSESVLQSAIARKEKSYNESSKPQRLTRQLKPTQKILENLAIAKQEKSKTERVRPAKQTNFQNSLKVEKAKYNDSDSHTETDSNKAEDNNERSHKKHKHKHHHNKHGKKYSKRMKTSYHDNTKESDSDQSMEDESQAKNAKNNTEEIGSRRSRRKSSSRLKDDSNTDMDEQAFPENTEEAPVYENDIKLSTVGAELIASRLCLCTHKTQYYLSTNDEEVTYCGAVDSVSDKIVGCSRVIDTKEIMMLRPSTRVPYGVLCESHRNRMLRHNCCPTCGIFCTQGHFVECEAKHQYHRDCQISVGNVECCPHCGLSTPDYDVNITMHSPTKPIILPMQKTQ